MASFNKVFLMGNLTRDPQVKNLPNLTVTEFGLAVNRRFKTAAGEDRDEVAFVDCTAFGRQAETISQYCTKGKPIFVEGRLKFESWDDKMGTGKRSKLVVVIENFQFLPTGDRMNGNGDSMSPFPESRPQPGNAPEPAPAPTRIEQPQSPNAGKQQRSRFRGKGAGEGRPVAAGKPFGDTPHFAEADIPF